MDILKENIYKEITCLVNKKEFEKVLEILKPFKYSVFNYIKDFPKSKFESKIAINLENLLKKGSANSIYRIEHGYCSKEYEEIISDINYCLLLLMNRYKEKDRHFLSYLCTCFPYEYMRLIYSEISDSLMNFSFRRSIDLKTIIDIKSDIENSIVNTGIIDEYASEDNYLNEFWYIYDIDEESLFYSFDKNTRKILYLYYNNSLPDIIIKDIIDCHINTVNKKRLNVINQLSNKLNMMYIRNRRVL